MRVMIKPDTVRLTFLCAICAIMVLMGIAFGAASAASLPADYRASLASRVALVSATDPGTGSIFHKALTTHLRTGVGLAIAGLSVIGAPAIAVILFGRGFATGFAAGLFTRELGGSGLLLALLSLFPGSVIWIPVTVFLGALSLLVTLVIASYPSPERGKLALVARYLVLSGILIAVLSGAAIIEAFLCPAFIRLASSFIWR